MAEVVDSIIAELIARDNGYIETFDKATAAHGRFKASVDKLKTGTFDLAAEGQKYKAGGNAIGQAEEETTARIARARKARVDVAVSTDKAITDSAKTAEKERIAAAKAAEREIAAARKASSKSDAAFYAQGPRIFEAKASQFSALDKSNDAQAIKAASDARRAAAREEAEALKLVQKAEQEAAAAEQAYFTQGPRVFEAKAREYAAIAREADASSAKQIEAARRAADAEIAQAERAGRLSAVAQRAVDRQQAGVPRGTGAMFGSTVAAGGSFVPASVVPAAAPAVEEVAAEKEINHLMADQATLQARLTVARGRDRDIIKDQVTEMRLLSSLVRSGYTEEEATLQVEKRMLAIEAERVAIAEKQRTAQITQFAAGSGLGRFGGANAATAGIAAAAAVGVGLSAVSSSIDFAKEIKNTADAVGLTTRQVQIYEGAARQAGVSTDQFRSGIGQLSSYLGRAKEGDEQAAKTFATLGINIKNAGSAGELLPTLIDRISSIADPAQRAAVETRLFGEEGRKLDAMLSGGNERVNELAAALEKTGAVLSSSDIQRLTDAETKLAGVKAQLQVDLAQVVAGNADAITGLAKSFADLADSIGGALKKVDEFSNSTGMGKLLSNPYGAGASVRSTIVNGVKSLFGYSAAPSSAEAAIPPKPVALGTVQPGKAGDLSKLFAPKPPKGKSEETLAREEAARQKRFTDQMARLDDQQLQARADTTSDEQERSAIEVERINRERKAALNDIKGNVDFTAAQKKLLVAAENTAADAQISVVDARDRISAIQRQAAADSLILDQKDAELKAQEDVATTIAERKRIELLLLANDQERQRIAGQTVLDRAKAGDASLSEQDVATARTNLKNLPAQGARETASINARDLGPLAEYMKSLPHTAAEIDEAFQRAAAGGLSDLNDGLTDTIAGFLHLHGVAGDFIKDLIKIGVERAAVGVIGSGSVGSGLFSAVSKIFSGTRAAGGNVVAGSTYLVGEHGPEPFTPGMSGTISPNQTIKSAGGGGTTIVQQSFTLDNRGGITTTDLIDHVNATAVQAAQYGARAGAMGGASEAKRQLSRGTLPRSAG